jgi:hypothetical protein
VVYSNITQHQRTSNNESAAVLSALHLKYMPVFLDKAGKQR